MPLSVRQECTVEGKSQNDFRGDMRVGFVEGGSKEGLKAREDGKLQVISLGGSYEICRRCRKTRSRVILFSACPTL